jgi:multidrug efflux pump subunit AcrB
LSRIIAWFVRNPVAANLLMLGLIGAGLAALPATALKAFPDIDVDIVTVSVAYLGATPEEVEESVCVRIEEEIDGIEGIEKISSTAAEGACAVVAELIVGVDANQATSDIKNMVDSITTFPDETEKPIVSKFTIKRSVADIAISGNADERTLKEIGERVRDEMAALPSVTQVDLTYTRPYEVSIEVPEASLRRHGLTFDQVVQAVRRSSLDLPGGSIKTLGGEILLRTKGQAYLGREFERIVIVTRPDGTRLTLGDIGVVVDGFEDLDVSARFNGEPAVLVRVFRVGEQNLLDIARDVKEYLPEAQMRLPDGIQLTLWKDGSTGLRLRIDTLMRNGRSGLLLVFVVLALFLRFRLAIWVGIGVPVAFLGSFTALPMLDISLDVISLFAFILVLGILVDDAIVVAENVYSHEQRHGDRLRAAIEGAQEVAVPVIFGVLTTVAAFMPLILAPGEMGQVFAVIGTVVVACLLFSVIESQLVLPSHLSHGHVRASAPEPGHGISGSWRRFQSGFARGLERFTRETYAPFLERAIEWRYLSLAVGVALLLVMFGGVAGGWMKFSFFPPIPADYATANLTLPKGVPLEVTQDAVAQLEGAAEQLRREVDEKFSAPDGASVFKNVLSAIGSHGAGGGGGPGASIRPESASTHLAQVQIEFIPSEQRTKEASTEALSRRWRELTGEIPDAVELTFASDFFSAGNAIEVELAGADVKQLRAAAEWLKERLSEYPGVVDVADSFRLGKQEIRLAVLPDAEPLGVTMEHLARQVRQAFYGEEAQRIQRGRDDVRVMVRYPEAERRAVGDLENLRIRTPNGAEVPFSTVARAELGRGFSSIEREQRRRIVSVSADVEREQTTANEVYASLDERVFPELLQRFPGVSFGIAGAQEEQREVFGGVAVLGALALLAIYALLAIPLKSYTQPFIIMSVIPFGLVGALLGHVLMGWVSPLWGGSFDGNLSFMSVNGMIALSGVVVNASLVLVVYVNRRREEGLPSVEAIREAAVGRFRPIVLTAVTTFVGLAPLMLERSLQAQFLIPMAISLAYGVVFATGVTLILVPCGYAIIEDAGAGLRRAVSSLRNRAGRAAATGAVAQSVVETPPSTGSSTPVSHAAPGDAR